MNTKRVHPLVLSGYGLVEAPFGQVVDRFGSHHRADQSATSVVARTSSVAEALEYLGRRTTPSTRLVIVEHGRWTAVLTNHMSGSDFNDHQYWVAKSVGVATIRVVDSQARWWRRGPRQERLGYEARIFELHAPGNDLLRSIACADDGGRWVFETSGTPLPIESTFKYDAPRKKERFTRTNLHDLLRSVGAEPLLEAALCDAPRFALLADVITDPAWRERVEATSCSLEEADNPAFGYFRRGLARVSHMGSQADSVIADFERAIEIDPALEPRVRCYLSEARRIAGR